jgi:hypothetical protein
VSRGNKIIVSVVGELMNIRVLFLLFLLALTSSVNAATFVRPDYSIPLYTYFGSTETSDICNIANGACIVSAAVDLKLKYPTVKYYTAVACIGLQSDCWIGTNIQQSYPGCSLFIQDFWKTNSPGLPNPVVIPRCINNAAPNCPTLNTVVYTINQWYAHNPKVTMSVVVDTISNWNTCPPN